MSTAKTNLTKPQGNGRMTFSKIAPAMELPNLISVQKESFEHFMGEGLAEVFRRVLADRELCQEHAGGLW